MRHKKKVVLIIPEKLNKVRMIGESMATVKNLIKVRSVGTRTSYPTHTRKTTELMLMMPAKHNKVRESMKRLTKVKPVGT